ncbi:MAG: sigma 54-interacting transcriptional regulator, partial [Limnohabitans sp.]
QERLIDPVGATRQIAIDVRVIAATHRDLEAEIQAGRFREDLYYRLNVLPVVTPPLRERKEDIPELLRFYANHYKLGHAPAVRFSKEFLQALVDYPWPGNVRELCNLIDRFSTLYAGQELELRAIPSNLLPKALVPIQAELLERSGPASHQEMSLPPEVLAEMQAAEATNPMVDQPEPQDNEIESIIMLAQGMPHLPPEGLSLKDRLAEIERNIIEQALERSQGNVSRTAKLLNLQRTTLIEKINKYELRTA